MDRDSMDMFMSNRFAGRTETISDTEAKKAYEEASGVNIEEQRELWNLSE